VNDPEQAEEMLSTILKTNLYTKVHCPCGTDVMRWNYAHHCKFPKHKAWLLTMEGLKNKSNSE
jgi:hypothetical protein